MAKAIRMFSGTLSALAFFALVAVIAGCWWVNDQWIPPAKEETRPSVAQWAPEAPPSGVSNADLASTPLDWSEIASPSEEFRLWTRWSPPGGHIEAESLLRQIGEADAAGGPHITVEDGVHSHKFAETEVPAAKPFPSSCLGPALHSVTT